MGKKREKTWLAKRMKLADLQPAAYNPRKMSPEALQGLEASMSRFAITPARK